VRTKSKTTYTTITDVYTVIAVTFRLLTRYTCTLDNVVYR